MSTVKVHDFTTLPEPSESVALIYFEEADGVVHVYRDGTVVLSSPQGTTIARLPHFGGRLWRKESYLGLLARLGATQEELARAAEVAEAREAALMQMGFEKALDHALAEARAHYHVWAGKQPPDGVLTDEEDIDNWLAAKRAELRSAHG